MGKSVQRRSQERGEKGGSDALKFFEAKCQADAEVKKEEVVLCQQELALQPKWQEKLQQQAGHQQQQFNLQQQQLQQTQNLIFALLQKNSKDKESKMLFELSCLVVHNYLVGLILKKKQDSIILFIIWQAPRAGSM